MIVYPSNLKIKHWNIIENKWDVAAKLVLRMNKRTSSSSSTNSLHQKSRLPRDSLLHSHVLSFTENRNRKQEKARVDRALAQAVSVRRLTTETHVRTHASPCQISGGQSGSWTGFSPSSSVFPFQYHSTMAPHPSLSTYSSYHKKKQAKSGNHPKSSTLSVVGQHCIEKHYPFFVTARLY